MSSIEENKKHLFVVPQLAIKAANKGYVDKYPIAHYVKGSNCNGDEFENWTLYFGGGTFFASDFDKHIPAPTYAEIVDWFREKHDVHILPMLAGTNDKVLGYIWYIQKGMKDTDTKTKMSDYYTSLEQAIEKSFELI
jgi:hypothetical protein